MTHTEHDALARSLLEINALRMENERLRKQRDVAVSIVHDFVALRRRMPTRLLDKALALVEIMKGESHE